LILIRISIYLTNEVLQFTFYLLLLFVLSPHTIDSKNHVMIFYAATIA